MAAHKSFHRCLNVNNLNIKLYDSSIDRLIVYDSSIPSKNVEAVAM